MDQINFTNPLVIIFVVGTIFSFLKNQILELVDFLSRKKNGGILPEEIKKYKASEVFDQEKLKKINSYKNLKYFFSIPEAVLSVSLTLILALSGFYPWILNRCLQIVSDNSIPVGFWQTYLSAVLFFVFASIPSMILSVPFEILDEFYVEKKFGFSKTTVKLWIQDQIKNSIVSLIFTAVLLLAMIFVMKVFPATWWIFLAAVIICFSLLIQVLYPLVIAPLFNKFSPLEAGELKTRLENLLVKIGFKSDGVFVMDASKRSGHSNAYFGGIGKSKRIVLYDTLVEQLTPEEIEAVLGHELGHYKLKHIVKKFFFVVPFMILLMFLLYYCTTHISIYVGFGFGFCQDAIVPPTLQFVGFFLANLVWGVINDFVEPITNYFSRKDEYQADKFSKDVTNNPDALISGLIKLNNENLSELLPSKIYVFWNYSHPTLVERIKNLN